MWVWILLGAWLLLGVLVGALLRRRRPRRQWRSPAAPSAPAVRPNLSLL